MKMRDLRGEIAFGGRLASKSIDWMMFAMVLAFGLAHTSFLRAQPRQAAGGQAASQTARQRRSPTPRKPAMRRCRRSKSRPLN